MATSGAPARGGVGAIDPIQRPAPCQAILGRRERREAGCGTARARGELVLL